MNLSESSLRYRGWRILLASSACVFVSFASLLVYTFGVFLKPLSADFHWSREAVSSAFGLAALSVAACSPLIGNLLDRFPARRIVLPCLAVFGCAFASLSLLSNHLWHLYATFIVLGIVGNGTAQLAYSRAVSTWFEEKRGMAFAILMCGGAVGAMLLPPLAQWLVAIAGWRRAFLLLGAMVLLIGLSAGSQIREKPVSELTPSVPKAGASVTEGLRSWIFWIIVLVLFCVSLGQNASIAHLAALLTDRGVSAASAALAVSVLGAATLLGRIGTGWLLDRCFAPRVSFCLLAVSAFGVFLLSSVRSAPIGFAGAALIGLGMGGEADVTPYLIAKYFGLRSFSTLYGFTWTAYAIAGAIGPVIMGKAFDATGSYAVLLLWLSLITAGAGALMLLLPRYGTRTRSIPQDAIAVALSAD